ncbi:hypothetical protein [Spirosoma oryzicola]|uniref:hypothetical protein n=1 Tax=Spirosoma oryzicola TaxID=2898794 RepID=UPI001E58FAAA|nr:hypothetical protein [Spirosoma oryzicola]UHG91780.1 hypothetical protein LQ777_02510 [Spirosoma oryzicola]
MKQIYTSRLIVFTSAVLVLLLDGCSKKEVVQPCYTCTSFVQYQSNMPSFNTPSPYTREMQVCDEAQKVKLEKGETKVESIVGTYTLTTKTSTVCYKKSI